MEVMRKQQWEDYPNPQANVRGGQREASGRGRGPWLKGHWGAGEPPAGPSCFLIPPWTPTPPALSWFPRAAPWQGRPLTVKGKCGSGCKSVLSKCDKGHGVKETSEKLRWDRSQSPLSQLHQGGPECLLCAQYAQVCMASCVRGTAQFSTHLQWPTAPSSGHLEALLGDIPTDLRAYGPASFVWLLPC